MKSFIGGNETRQKLGIRCGGTTGSFKVHFWRKGGTKFKIWDRDEEDRNLGLILYSSTCCFKT